MPCPMQAAELVRVALFSLVVLGVYLGAAGALVAAARGSNPTRKLSRRGRVLVALAALGTLCILYGFLIEPYWLETTHVTVTSSRVERPLRIAHLSDLHCDARPRLEERLPAAVASERPDVIVFTGDSANSPEGVPVLKGVLSALARIAPTYVVRGNWDTHGHKLDWQEDSKGDLLRGLFEGTGVHELDGEAVPLRSDVWVSGIPYHAQSKIAPTLAKVPPEAFSIFLCHWPDEIEEVARLGADLYLCGHTHGGQVALPFYGALVTFSKYGKRFESGAHVLGARPTHLYVNRGIGMDGLGAPRVRFCARPELTIIDVQPP